MYYRKKRTYKSKYTRKYKQRRYKRDALGRSRVNQGIVRVTGGNVLPAMLQTQLKFTTKITFAITNGVATAINLLGNSLYDPLYVSGSSQPQMFTELSTYYTRYNVTGSKVVLELHNLSTTDPVDFYITPTTDINATYNFYVASTMPGAQKCTVPTANSDNHKTVSAYRRSATVWGLDTFDNAMSAQYNSNPSALWYWRLECSSAIVGSTASLNVYATVYITFYTVFSQPRVVAQGSNA